MIAFVDTTLTYVWPVVTLMLIGVVFVLPLALFRGARGFVGGALYWFSRALAFAIWLWGLLVVLVMWGWWGVLAGLLLAGVGVVPLGAVALGMAGAWSSLGQMVVAVLVTWGAHFASERMLASASATEAGLVDAD